MKVRVTLDLDAKDLDDLISITNVLREDPRKRWTDTERKECARLAIEEIVRRRIAAYRTRGMFVT